MRSTTWKKTKPSIAGWIPLGLALVLVLAGSLSGFFRPTAVAAGSGAAPILLGVYPTGYIDQAAIDQELAAFDAWAGKRSSLVALYSDLGDPYIDYNLQTQLDLLWENGYTPYLNLMAGRIDASVQPSAAQIASGAYDSEINRWAQAYAAWASGGKWAFVSILPEMNVDWASYGMDPANYPLAFTHVQQVFAQNGVPRDALRYVFAPNTWFGNPYEAYYPGEAAVDVVGLSSFNFGFCQGHTTWDTPEQIFGPHLRTMQVLAPGKPIFVSQLGTSAAVASGAPDPDQKNQWLRGAYGYLGNWPGVRAVLYKNVDLSWECDWAVYKAGSTQYVGYQEGVSNTAYDYMSPNDLRQADLKTDLRSVFLPMSVKSYNYSSKKLPLMLGMYADTSTDWLGSQQLIDSQFRAIDTWTGKKTSIVGTFINIEVGHPEYNIPVQLDRIWENGYTPFVNLSAYTSAYDIASGRQDTNLRNWAQAYKTYARGGGRVAFIAPLNEMDGDWVPYGVDPSNFKLAYRHIRDIFDQEGVPQNSVYWTFAPTGYDHPEYYPFEDYYPGNDFVDVVGFSSYNIGYCPLARNQWPKWKSPQELLGEYIDRMRQLAPGKPLFITQFGASSDVAEGTANNDVKSQWIKDTYTYLANYTDVQGILYFNYDISWQCDWAFYKTWGTNQRVLEGYRQGALHSDFSYVAPLELMATMSKLLQ